MAISIMTRLVVMQGESHSPITVPRLSTPPFTCSFFSLENHLASRSASDNRRKSCAGSVIACFERNITLVGHAGGCSSRSFLTEMNFITRWTNLGFVKEAVIA